MPYKPNLVGNGPSGVAAAHIQDLMRQAIASHQRRGYAAAESGYREVLHLVPAHPDATHFLGLLLHQSGREREGLVLLHRAAELDPGNPLYRHNLAGAYKEMRQYVQAAQYYREALAVRADYVDSYVGLAAVELAGGQYQAALADYERALALNADHYAAGMGWARVLHELGRDDDAVQAYGDLARRWNNDVEKLQSITQGLREAGESAQAVSCLQRVIALDPGNVEARNTLGITLANLGDLKGAEACYREALRIKPDHVGALYNLTYLVRLDSRDPLWPSLMALAERVDSLSPKDALVLHFALGKMWEDAGDYTRAFHHFTEGNRIKRTQVDYDEPRQARFIRNYIHYFDTNFVAAADGVGLPDDKPIFIVGMPRSGTTLVEQILSSHPQVYGAGELELLWRCVRAELGIAAEYDDDVPVMLKARDISIVRSIAESYCASLWRLAPAAAHITNKLPGNVSLVGLIHMALPNARIIHCLRDPLDTCVSCFSKLFSRGHLFTYDLGELGRYYRLYEDLMQHWRTVLPAGSMLELRYEDLVTDLESQTRRLLAYCHLPWDNACLRFHEAARPVRTASLVQVRRPIYQGSVGRWRRYEKFLGPLRQALREDASVR